MIGVILAGNTQKDLFGETLKTVLSRYCKVTSLIHNCLSGAPFSESDILLIENVHLSRVTLADVIVVADNWQTTNLPDLSEDTLCIVDSSNAPDVEIVKNSNAKVITCGMSLKDTITFSSCDDNKRLISVQRQLKNFKNEMVEPFELSIDMDGKFSDFGILAAVLILILGGFI